MSRAVVVKSKRVGQRKTTRPSGDSGALRSTSLESPRTSIRSSPHLLMVSLIPLFVGIISAITGVLEMVQFERAFKEISLRFVFSGILIVLALVMMAIGWRLEKR